MMAVMLTGIVILDATCCLERMVHYDIDISNHDVMIRTQISLTTEQADRLRHLAASRNVSQSSLVRQAVEDLLQSENRATRLRQAREVIGAHRSEYTSTATHHDEALDEALSA